MQYQISTTQLRDNILIPLPASKSISNRALIIQGLCNSPCQLSHLSDCDDTAIMIRAFQTERQPADNHRVIDIGAAGTSMRFLTALFATQPGEEVTITGSIRMRQRPIGILVDALRTLGADIRYAENEGFPPLHICGRTLCGGELMIDGSVSSQYISALLMIAPRLTNGLKLQFAGKITSVPYIHMTLGMMQQFGIKSSWEGDTITILPQRYEPQPYPVESDWSAASYWYEMLALSSLTTIRLQGLRENSLQGDARIADFFRILGIETVFADNDVVLHRHQPAVQAVQWDLGDQPDLAQTLIVTCCALGIHFEITGLHTLRIKETDRIAALQHELHKLGFVVADYHNHTMSWQGERCQPESSPVIATYDDHRMAMAFAPLAQLPQWQGLRIDHPQVVSKSYPTYWNHLQDIGFNLSPID